MSFKIYIIGHRGYLGSHLSHHFSQLGYSVHSLDSRNLNLGNMRLGANDIVIDCSRIKEFDQATLRKDYKAAVNVLELVAFYNSTYVRIGSVLEVDREIEVNPYIDWSKRRSNLVLESRTNVRARVILVPNIYGGDKSPSIIDRLQSAIAKGNNLQLKNPGSKRDFLSINNFLNSVKDTLFTVPSVFPFTTVLTSGYKYEVGSIQSFLKSQNAENLLREPISYVVLGEIKQIGEALLDIS